MRADTYTPPRNPQMVTLQQVSSLYNWLKLHMGQYIEQLDFSALIEQYINKR